LDGCNNAPILLLHSLLLLLLLLPPAAGDVWHVAVQGLPGSGVCYALRVHGDGGWDTGYRWDASRLLLDPRAPLVAGRSSWGKREELEDFQQNVRGAPCVSGSVCFVVCGGRSALSQVSMRALLKSLPPHPALPSLVNPPFSTPAEGQHLVGHV
jgi:hypothetical protein